ncbi:DUF47 family protein [Dermabacteraceae bacterium TAE3-ERU27]|nr:DUF47 family protein [Dermabacteraceae bacterium TAE3-ERU27]
MKFFSAQRERSVHDLLGDTAHLVAESSQTLARCLGSADEERPVLARRLDSSRREAADLSRRISNRLASALITPFEADVLLGMAHCLSDAVNRLERVSSLVVTFRMGSLPSRVLDVVEDLIRLANSTADVLWKLSDMSAIDAFCVDMPRQLGNTEGLCRQALHEIYAEKTDPVSLLQLRDVVEGMREVALCHERFVRLADRLRVKDS